MKRKQDMNNTEHPSKELMSLIEVLAILSALEEVNQGLMETKNLKKLWNIELIHFLLNHKEFLDQDTSHPAFSTQE